MSGAPLPAAPHPPQEWWAAVPSASSASTIEAPLHWKTSAVAVDTVWMLTAAVPTPPWGDGAGCGVLVCLGLEMSSTTVQCLSWQ